MQVVDRFQRTLVEPTIVCNMAKKRAAPQPQQNAPNNILLSLLGGLLNGQAPQQPQTNEKATRGRSEDSDSTSDESSSSHGRKAKTSKKRRDENDFKSATFVAGPDSGKSISRSG